MSEAYPHLIFDGFKTKLGKRIVQILKNLFPAGVKRDDGRAVTFKAGDGDYISVRHHVYVKTGWDKVELAEVGPRMEMKVCFSLPTHTNFPYCSWGTNTFFLVVIRN